MISSADVFLFDEPTSGLSSKDSEHVIEIIRSMAHNKIVLVTIHQPTLEALPDVQQGAAARQRREAGLLRHARGDARTTSPQAEHEQHFGTELGGCPACGTTRPEFIFDVLETPLRDLSGDIIYEENSQGQLVPARRFSPDYWRDKYESFRLLQDVKQVNLRKAAAPRPTPLDRGALTLRKRERDSLARRVDAIPHALAARLHLEAAQPWQPDPDRARAAARSPALIGWALYFTDDESGKYNFASAFHIPTYIFIALLVALFLALMNSVDDIIRDRVVLHRERNLDVRLAVLHLREIRHARPLLRGAVRALRRSSAMPFSRFAGCSGRTSSSCSSPQRAAPASGCSSAPSWPTARPRRTSSRSCSFPQLIFGGALIKYEEMNHDLDAIYTFQALVQHASRSRRPPGREDAELHDPADQPLRRDALQLRGADRRPGEAQPAGHPPGRDSKSRSTRSSARHEPHSR